jgi:predicted DNA-binding transcriptional regulator YafY
MCQVRIDYTNWKGERGVRVIIPYSIVFDANEFHKEEQWLLEAFDVSKNVMRTFAMKGIHLWEPV